MTRLQDFYTDEVYGNLFSSCESRGDTGLNPTLACAVSNPSVEQFVMAYFKTYWVETNFNRAANKYAKK